MRLVTVSEGIELVEPVARELAPSTWGTGKDFTTWDSPAVAELAFAARGAELRTVAAVAGHGARHPALERAARELLAHPVERLVVHGHPRPGARTIPPSGCACTAPPSTLPWSL